MDVDCVPLYLETKDGTQSETAHGWNLLEMELNPGDVLYLTIPATKLELLWRVDGATVLSSSTANVP
jgi:hypothetical protein